MTTPVEPLSDFFVTVVTGTLVSVLVAGEPVLVLATSRTGAGNSGSAPPAGVGCTQRIGSPVAQFCNAVPNQCDSRGRLTHLSLMSEGLSCPFPRALNRLSALTRLDLTFNTLYGRCTSPRTTSGLLYLSHLL